eukprot:COSAG01_NODE_44588_length_417_cov_1.644654_1_plen_87_part_10
MQARKLYRYVYDSLAARNRLAALSVHGIARPLATPHSESLGRPRPAAEIFAWPLEIAWPRAPSHRIPWPSYGPHAPNPYTTNSSYGL